MTTPQQFYDLLNIELISFIFGLGMFSFLVGYSTGYIHMFIRKVTSSAL